MIISVHHYELAETVTDEEFQDVIQEAEQRELFTLPGLVEYQFLRGIKGVRKKGYTALWMYESRQAWRNLWGSVDDPVPKNEYPSKWNIWEDELLAPLLTQGPDKIDYTTYEIVAKNTRR